MPRYRLTQTQEALGRHDEPKPVETYFDGREFAVPSDALAYARDLLNGYPCRIG